ncbi:MAG: NAD(P)/FAD-dependent oxidoreductase, partial [Actinomycetota bacterium]
MTTHGIDDPAATPSDGQPRPPKPHVVIVGGGFGGLYAARSLKPAPVRVTIIDRRNYHLFQPLLYQVATALLNPADIASPIRKILRSQKNARPLLGEVNSIDLQSRKVELADGQEISYDYLVLATGSSHSYFGNADWAVNAPGLKTVEDALEIRRRILSAYEHAEREEDPAARRKLLTFVIVGAGPTGVELAGALADVAHALAGDFRSLDPKTVRIALVEAGPRILPTFPEDLAAWTAAVLQSRGIEVATGKKVTVVDDRGVNLNGQRLEAGSVLWAAGVQASELARCLGVPLHKAGRVPVESHLTVAG